MVHPRTPSYERNFRFKTVDVPHTVQMGVEGINTLLRSSSLVCLVTTLNCTNLVTVRVSFMTYFPFKIIVSVLVSELIFE